MIQPAHRSIPSHRVFFTRAGYLCHFLSLPFSPPFVFTSPSHGKFRVSQQNDQIIFYGHTGFRETSKLIEDDPPEEGLMQQSSAATLAADLGAQQYLRKTD